MVYLLTLLLVAALLAQDIFVTTTGPVQCHTDLQMCWQAVLTQ